MSSIILEGEKESYKLLFSIDAIEDIEKTLKLQTIWQVFGMPWGIALTKKVFAVAIQYGEGKKVSYKEAGEMIQDICKRNSYAQVQREISASIEDSLGIQFEPKKEDKESEDEESEEGK